MLTFSLPDLCSEFGTFCITAIKTRSSTLRGRTCPRWHPWNRHVGPRWKPEQPLIPTVRNSVSTPPVKLPKLQLLPWSLQAHRDRLHAARFINYSPKISALPRCRSNPPPCTVNNRPNYNIWCAHILRSDLDAAFFSYFLKGEIEEKGSELR